MLYDEQDSEVVLTIIASICDDIAAGEEDGEPWEVADRDAWDAVQRWLGATEPMMRDLAARTATLLRIGADVLWIRHLVDWADEHVVPGLWGVDLTSYTEDRQKVLDRSLDPDVEEAHAMLSVWALIAGCTLPVRP